LTNPTPQSDTAFVDPDSGQKSQTQTPQMNNVAKSELHKKNRKGNVIRLLLPLSLSIRSGQNYQLSGFGTIIDGKCIVVQVTHTVTRSAGSTTTVTLQRCLNYTTTYGASSGSSNSNVIGVHQASAQELANATANAHAAGF
jgi:phage protein D